jgi:hypothetical protein
MEYKKPKTKDYTTQPVKMPEIVRPDYDYGYKDRPLNAKRANYNTYLPYISIN